MKKNWMQPTVLLLLAGLVGVSGWSLAEAKGNKGSEQPSVDWKAGQTFAVPAVNLGGNAYVVHSAQADVNGDQVKDQIVLVGMKEKADDIYASQLHVVVQDGKTKIFSKTDEKDFGGYEATLFVGDFTGDKVADIMVTAPTGGSGGITDHRIFSWKENKPTTIFSDRENQGVLMKGKFVDGFKVEATVTTLSKNITIDASANQDLYVAQEQYRKDGKLLQPMEVEANPYSQLTAVDYEGDDVYELEGHQRVTGFYNADTISNIRSIWAYKDGKWSLAEAECSTILKRFGT